MDLLRSTEASVTLVSIISIIFSGEKKHKVIRRMQTQSLFFFGTSLCNYSTCSCFWNSFRWQYYGAFFYEIIKQQGLIRLFLAKVTVILYWKYCLSAQQFINVKTRTAEFVAFNNVLYDEPISFNQFSKNYLAHNVNDPS